MACTSSAFPALPPQLLKDVARRCALFGGYTVLSTKALSSLLSRMFVKIFRYPITWVLIVVLVATSVLQIRYLNRALMAFEGKVRVVEEVCKCGC